MACLLPPLAISSSGSQYIQCQQTPLYPLIELWPPCASKVLNSRGIISDIPTLRGSPPAQLCAYLHVLDRSPCLLRTRWTLEHRSQPVCSSSTTPAKRSKVKMQSNRVEGRRTAPGMRILSSATLSMCFSKRPASFLMNRAVHCFITSEATRLYIIFQTSPR
jgi:hypothetical protein